jgi:hypothetical protein
MTGEKLKKIKENTREKKKEENRKMINIYGERKNREVNNDI